MEEEAPGTQPAKPDETPRMCFACGAYPPPDARRCPSCGAPLRPSGAKPTSRMPVFAAFILFALFLNAVVLGTILLVDPQANVPTRPTVGGQDYEIQGRVIDPDGNPVSGANVTITNLENQTNRTDATGHFRFSNLPFGYAKLHANASGWGAAETQVFLMLESVETDLELAPKNQTNVVEHASYTTMLRAFQVCGGLFVGLALLILAGAVACYRRRSYRLALAASIVSLVAWLPFSPLLGTIAIVLVVKSRREFG